MSERTAAPQNTSTESDVPFREAYPSGWRALTKNDSVCAMIDAMLDLPPHREFNQTELADMANVSRQSVNRHIDLLANLGIVERVDGSSPQRFRFDTENAVSQALIRLDGVIRAAGADASS
ncbi:MarR family transcriptional regulator [Halovivax cerinus]|uniref:MarR family transcriptional regulator n=1 Tax=Halovivax cerinus TaxID=1487865 RepID=A0ABD5NU94_9EURY|nr:helix-turn-helix domain-containing protein [Halovivax cerinus]